MSYDPVGYRRAAPYGHQPYGKPEPPVIYGRSYAPAPPPPPPRRRRRSAYLALAAAVVFLAGGVWSAYDRNLILKDSGIKACEAMRDNGTGYDAPRSEAEYRTLRRTFEKSRYDDIRYHGTKLVDATWQVSRLPDDETMRALTEHTTGLHTACADQGVIVNPS